MKFRRVRSAQDDETIPTVLLSSSQLKKQSLFPVSLLKRVQSTTGPSTKSIQHANEMWLPPLWPAARAE